MKTTDLYFHLFHLLSYKISFHLWNTIVTEWQEPKERGQVLFKEQGQACNPATYMSLMYNTTSRLHIISYTV